MKKIYSIFLCLFILLSLFDGIEVKALDNRTFYSPNDNLGSVRDFKETRGGRYLVDESNILWFWGTMYKEGSTTFEQDSIGVPIKLAQNVKEVFLNNTMYGLDEIYIFTIDNKLYRLTSPAFDEFGWSNDKVYILNQPTLLSDNISKVFHNGSNLYFITIDSKLYGLGWNYIFYNSGEKENYPNQLGTFEGEYSNTPIFIASNVKDFYNNNDMYYITNQNELFEIYSYGPLKISSNVKTGFTSYNVGYVLKNDGNVYKIEIDYSLNISESIFMQNVKDLYSNSGNEFFAITNDNSLYSWGEGDSLGVESEYEEDPIKILSDISRLQHNFDEIYAISTTGNLYAWGRNSLYVRDNETNLKTPKLILDNIKTLYISNYDTKFFLKNDNSLWESGEITDTFGNSESVYHPFKINDNVSKLFESYDMNPRFYLNTNNELYDIDGYGNSILYIPYELINKDMNYKIFENSGGFGTPVYDQVEFNDYASVTFNEENGNKIEIEVNQDLSQFDNKRLGFEIYRSTDNVNFSLIGRTNLSEIRYIQYNVIDGWYFKYDDRSTKANTTYFYAFRAVEDYYYPDVNDLSNMKLKHYGKMSSSYTFDSSFYVENLEYSTSNNGEVLINWKLDSSILGYEIYKLSYDTWNYELLADISNNSYKPDDKLSVDENFQFKIIPYKIVNNQKTYGCPHLFNVYHDFYFTNLNLSKEFLSYTKLKLSWDDFYGIDRYDVYRSYESSGSERELIYSGYLTYFEDDVLESHERIYYQVEGINIYDSENESSMVYSQLYLYYENPYYNQIDLKVSKISSTQNKLEWNMNGKSHNIYRSKFEDFSNPILLGNTSNTSFVDTVDSTNNMYYYAVSYDECWSKDNPCDTVISNLTPSIDIRDYIELRNPNVTANSALFEWNILSGYSNYELSYSKDYGETFSVIKNTIDLSFNHTGLSPSTFYMYKIRGYKLIGSVKEFSDYSETIYVITAPETPKLRATSIGTDSILLSWDAVPDASHYELYQNNQLLDTLESDVLSKEISGLELGTIYKFYLVALNYDLRSAPSNEVSASPAPEAVNNFKISEVKYNGFSLDWDEVAGADHYDVYQGTSSTTVTTKVGSVTTSNFTISTALSFNTTYYYKVIPVTSTGTNGTASNIISGKTALSTPTNVKVSAQSGTSLNITYDSVLGATGYEIYSSKGTSTTYTLVKSQTGTTPVLHTGLTSNTIYNYKVRAYRLVGTTKVYGAYSEISSLPTPPLSSVLKVISKDATTLSLSWTSVAGITEFNLFKDGELVDVYAPTVLSAELSGLVTGQTYQLSLHAINGELGTSSIVNVSAAPIPAAVGNFKISEVRFNGFSLDWDEVTGADHYDVFQGTSSTAVTTKVGSVTDSSFTTTTLLNFNTTYYYKVVPVTLSGLNGTASMILTGKTAISAPTGVSVLALSGSSTSISYEAVNGAAGYEVHFSKGTSLTYTLLKTQTTVTPVVQTGLTANTVYNYKVRAYRMSGTTKVYSAFSEVKSITTPPSTPVLKVVSKDSSTLSLSWATVPGATQYELYQNSVLIDTLASSVLTKDISGLELGSSYKYTLVALNGELRSASSVEVTGIPVPAAVSNLKFSEIRFNGFSLDWDEVAGADHYDVFQGTSSTAVTTKVGSVTDSNFTTTTLLNFNTTYYYKVVPVTLTGLNGSASMILTGKTAISAPTGVSVTALSGNSTSISYEAVNGAAGYEVHYSKGTSLTYTLLKAQTTVTPVVQTGLTANTVYNYKVRAYRMAGTTKVYSAFSEVKSITTPPSTPVIKVVSKNSDTLSLTWVAVPGATQYELYQNSVLVDTLASSVLSKDISGLELGSSYKYKLIALNGELRSASSVEVTGIPVPAAVGNLKFSEIRFNGFSLDWDEVTGADHYDVFQGTSSTAVTTKVGSVTDSSFTTTTLLNFNTTYYYKVVPVTLSGLNGTASMILTGKTAISAPIGVSVSALSGSSTSVSYEAVNGAAGYEVHYSKGTSLTYTLLKAQTTVTPVVQTGLTSNTVYNYKVRAYRMAGTTKVYSAFSEVKSITTPPSTPVLKVSSKNSDTLSLTWVAVPGATQYELYHNSVLIDTVASTVLTKDISGLELGSSYKYTLVALNGELRSASSVEVTGIPVPAAVGSLKFSEIRFNGFSLDWDEVVGADHYDVFQGTSSTAVTTKVGSVTDSNFTTTTLLNFNTTYYYKVIPVTLSGLNGTASMILTGKTVISAPTGVSVSALSGSSTSVSYESVNGAAGYEVHYSKGTSLTYTLLKAQTTVTPIIQTGLTANTVYNYKVRAYRMAGTTKVYSAFSEVKSITTPPSTPVLKAVSKNSSTLTLSWAAVPGATSYEVYKDATLLDTVSSSVLSLDVNSLNVGQSYGFYIVALNGELRSSNSTVVNGVPVPGAVSNFKLVDTQYNGFSLDWDGVAGADHYDVFQGTTSTTVTTKLASVTESEFKTTASLNFNTSYYYKVVPVTSGGLNGNASSVLTAKTALAKPLNVVGNYLTNTSIELKWDAVSGAAGYEISYSKGTSSTYTVLRSVTTLSTTHTGLTENTAYNYRVRAYRMSGTVKLYSAYSDLVTPVLSMYEAINLLEYNDITSLDIHVAVDDSSWSTLVNTMEGLVSLSKTAGEVESGVASSWSFDEPTLTWTFNLNPNAVWVNNQGLVQRSVTASDFVYAWDRLASDTNYQYNYYLDYILFIESYQAVNATTLKVKVTEYQPFFLNSLVKPNMFPMAPENLSTFGAEYGNSSNSVWYNGAYYLSSWNKGVNAKWTKNNKYWNAGIVKTPEVNIKFDSTGDLNAELTEFDTGLIDLMTLSGDNYASRKNDSSLVLFPESAMYYLFMNTANSGMINGSPVIDETAGNPLFDNRKIRQAIAYYLDKEKVTNAIGSYPYRVANYFVPSNFVSYNGNAYESSRGNGYMLKNQDLARSLFVEGMTELGYVEGDNTLSVDYVVYESTIAQTIADTIISDLNVLFNGYGITVNKRVVPFVDFLSELDNGSYDMAYMGWGPDYRWPTTYLDNYLSYSAYNNIGYNNSTYDDLLNPYGKTMSQVWSDLQLAEKVLLEDASFIPISQRVLPRLVSSRLKGVSLNYSDIGLYYKWIYKE